MNDIVGTVNFLLEIDAVVGVVTALEVLASRADEKTTCWLLIQR